MINLDDHLIFAILDEKEIKPVKHYLAVRAWSLALENETNKKSFWSKFIIEL